MNRNQYVGTEIKWVMAQRIDGGEWAIRHLGSGENVPSLDDSRMLDETPLGEMKKSEFAIFKNTTDWWTKKPRRYQDWRDKSDWPIMGLSGLINSLPSDWF